MFVSSFLKGKLKQPQRFVRSSFYIVKIPLLVNITKKMLAMSRKIIENLFGYSVAGRVIASQIKTALKKCILTF